LDQVQTLAAAVAKATPMDDDFDDYEEEETNPDTRTAGGNNGMSHDNVGTSSRAKTVQSALANLERDSTYDKIPSHSYLYFSVSMTI
jgi:hypothetical protein